MKLSIIVAAYNLEDSLHRCVRSLQAQTYSNIEIIIVNDKSTDLTLELAIFLSRTDPKKRTKVISHLKNRGLSSVRNTGLDAATGDYVWQIDGDDMLISETTVGEIAQILNSHSLNFLFINKYIQTLPTSWIKDSINTLKSEPNTLSIYSPEEFVQSFGCGSIFCFIFKKSFSEINSLRSIEKINIGEDQIFNSQLLHFAESIPVCNKKFYIYDKTDASMMRSPWNIDKFIEENYYIKFMGKAFINKPRLLETSLKARCQYLKTSMCTKLIQDLSITESRVIKYLWSNTLQSLDQSFSEIKIDSELKDFNESLENRIPGCIDLESSQDFKCLFQGTQIKCIKIDAPLSSIDTYKRLTKYTKHLALHGIILITISSLFEQIQTNQYNANDAEKNSLLIKSFLIDALNKSTKSPETIVLINDLSVNSPQNQIQHQSAFINVIINFCIKGGALIKPESIVSKNPINLPLPEQDTQEISESPDAMIVLQILHSLKPEIKPNQLLEFVSSIHSLEDTNPSQWAGISNKLL
ncbi:glycosyltransferase family A protein [Synechococcus sp. MU1625]|uniref:glycosyltransferase family 2 protein n=1 Tax=Synechococcus sp. MU1625 TaxID=2508347 RepID=UPI001CF8D754|nr:glycosyltransferase family A protein [Synechococcus sp. MU1625]MCB4400722.1 glycosyltransferase family 2 protein [Synechococcus sp. MU1625]